MKPLGEFKLTSYLMFLTPAPAALSQLAGYVPAISNPYGITLDREWTEWAANIGVSPTVAAALLLICQARPLDEIVARLTPGELEQVAEIVGRCPDHFPSGTLNALKSCSPTSSHEPPSANVSTDQTPRQQAARTSAESLRRHRPYARKHAGRPFEYSQSAIAAAMHISGMPNPYGIKLDDASIRWAAAEGVSETIIAAVLLLHEKSVDEVAAKLRPDELAHVVRFVSRCPSCYPHGTLAALRSLRPVSERPSVSTSNHQPPSRRPGRIIAKGLHTRAHALRFGHQQSTATTLSLSCRPQENCMS